VSVPWATPAPLTVTEPLKPIGTFTRRIHRQHAVTDARDDHQVALGELGDDRGGPGGGRADVEPAAEGEHRHVRERVRDEAGARRGRRPAEAGGRAAEPVVNAAPGCHGNVPSWQTVAR